MKSLLLLVILFGMIPLAYSAQEESVLEQAPAGTPQIQNMQGQEKSQVLVDEQIMVVADVTNAQTREQPFAYIVQIHDDSGTVVSLGWLLGTLAPEQRLSPGLAWTPQSAGVYSATVFVWESIDNPAPLSHSLSIDIDVRESLA